MPEPTSSSGTRSKPATRSSLRHSLNFASMGKALVDVINKEARDGEKAAKKTKEVHSRRSSAIHLQPPSAPRTSLGDSKPMFLSKKEDSPETKTITRRRMSMQKAVLDDSATSSDVASPPQAGVKRSSSLRPRMGGSTALPKYRPKSAIYDSGIKIPSPPRSGKKRPDSSDEDRQVDNKLAATDKDVQRISPLPRKSAIKANLSNAIHLSPATTPIDTRPTTPKSSKSSSAKSSPSRLAKHTKSASVSAIRPPSVSSTTSSHTPRTPKTPLSSKLISGSRRSVKEVVSQSDSSQRGSPYSSASESPLARHSRHHSASITPTKSRSSAKDVLNMSHISEVDSEDSFDADDVELLLAPVTHLAAPTPAMPRLQTRRQREEPETPTRGYTNNLPTRANMSYLSPLPPTSDDSPPSLRPPKQGSAKAARGSILSWDQIAEEASRVLEPGEVESMISDIPAPFAPGLISPAPSNSFLPDVPESPCLSSINSPSGYGSISQVLLPDVTPSPAVHHYSPPARDRDLDGAADASLVTLLRLQLAAAENTAKERLYQMQVMEKEIHTVKNTRRQDEENLTQQLDCLETNMREQLEARERTECERQVYIASLELRLQQTDAAQSEAVDDAVAKAAEALRRSHARALRVESCKWTAAYSAREASSKWFSIRDEAQILLEDVNQDREVLAILKAELDLLDAAA
ncbi:hypothetical protein PC9H_004000 [Pleurotus ostreatus]|uniref:Uncharacterized protein n=1 Tax=Pleurotus ostreatus TaxID=5322 RepID=A0A8H7DUF2_PLEOS|nr:uncharacterized protein PC9H_004000 [Pleurotus ostreatus]KAF7437164.1 hypothetical protein PC9H_004000 [Pleurotus ostreatus]KAJ8703037.1 hypothetical protein PTI98_001694 [Pleurotus ostreatus]